MKKQMVLMIRWCVLGLVLGLATSLLVAQWITNGAEILQRATQYDSWYSEARMFANAFNALTGSTCLWVLLGLAYRFLHRRKMAWACIVWGLLPLVTLVLLWASDRWGWHVGAVIFLPSALDMVLWVSFLLLLVPTRCWRGWRWAAIFLSIAAIATEFGLRVNEELRYGGFSGELSWKLMARGVYDFPKEGGFSGELSWKLMVFQALAAGMIVFWTIMVWREHSFAQKAASAAVRNETAVDCPYCQAKLPSQRGIAICRPCGLRLRIEVEELRCERCNYSLRGLTGTACPECGRVFAATAAVPAGGEVGVNEKG